MDRDGTNSPHPPKRRVKGPGSARSYEIIKKTSKPFQVFIDSPEGSTVPFDGLIAGDRAMRTLERLKSSRA